MNAQENIPMAELSLRARSALHRALAGRPATTENFRSLTQRDLFSLAGVGRRTLKEIVDWAIIRGVPISRG